MVSHTPSSQISQTNPSNNTSQNKNQRSGSPLPITGKNHIKYPTYLRTLTYILPSKPETTLYTY
jgi:hypothetical protein